MNNPLNVLVWGDTPTGITGFGKVIKNIIRQIYDKEKYKIDVLGISYLGDPYRPDKYNGEDILYDVYTPFEVNKQMDLYGGGKLQSFLSSGKVDILFILQDTFIAKNVMDKIVELRNKLSNKFVIIYYYPIDSAWLYPDWITKSVSLTDIPVCYTEFGKSVTAKYDPKLRNIDVIYHGTDKSLYKPWPNDMRLNIKKSFWGQGFEDKFIVLNVNRNQPRKDLDRTFAVFAEFKKRVPEAFLFCLSNPADIGGNIIDVALQHGLIWTKDWMSPDPTKYNPSLGIPEEQIVTMYNTADVCISTTLGEGWGLSLTEAMACGCPVVFPDNTSITEIIGTTNLIQEGLRGTLVPSGEDGNTICLGPQDNNLVRPLTDVMAMVDAIENVYNNPDKYRKIAELAVDWVPSWEEVGEKWRKIFDEAIVIKKSLEQM